MQRENRRLAAIVAADIVGYSPFLQPSLPEVPGGGTTAANIRTLRFIRLNQRHVEDVIGIARPNQAPRSRYIAASRCGDSRLVSCDDDVMLHFSGSFPAIGGIEAGGTGKIIPLIRASSPATHHAPRHQPRPRQHDNHAIE